jgi:DNA-binding NarL/FixJ family response regulator
MSGSPDAADAAPGRVHILHDRPLVVAGLRALLEADGWVVSLHGTQPARLPLADVVVADHDAGMLLAGAGPGARIMIVTHRGRESDVKQALAAAIGGYVLEHATEAQVLRAVYEVFAGRTYLCPASAARLAAGFRSQPLTGREREVLHLLARGHCNKRIARELEIGLGTVKTHVRGVMGKLEATTRTQAVIVAASQGLVGFEAGLSPA